MISLFFCCSKRPTRAGGQPNRRNIQNDNRNMADHVNTWRLTDRYRQINRPSSSLIGSSASASSGGAIKQGRDSLFKYNYQRTVYADQTVWCSNGPPPDPRLLCPERLRVLVGQRRQDCRNLTKRERPPTQPFGQPYTVFMCPLPSAWDATWRRVGMSW